MSRFRSYDPGRAVDATECVLSVLLAISLAHLIGAANVSWAAFSGYMVMRGHVAQSLLRGILRIVGTIAGAALGLLLVPLVVVDLPLTSIALMLVGGLSLYAALTGKRAYAWLFVGLTFVMILLDKVQHPDLALAGFARTRLLEVCAGTAACVVVSTLSTATLRRIWPAPPAPEAVRLGWHPQAVRHAAQAAIALLLVPVVGIGLHLPALSQSAVAIIAVMLVPMSSTGASGFGQVSRRLANRVIGCLAGAGLAAVFLFIGQGSAPVLIAGTMLGVVLGRHLENGKSSVAYAGTQFVLAILVTLVPDNYADASIRPALERLAGTLIGLALLEPILLLWHMIAPGQKQQNGSLETEAGGI